MEPLLRNELHCDYSEFGDNSLCCLKSHHSTIQDSMSNSCSNSFSAAQKLSEIFSNRKGTPSLFLTSSERETVIKMCIHIKSMMNWDFNFEEFRDILCKISDLPVEVFWNLHFLQIMPLDMYLIKLDSNTLDKLKLSVSNLCLMDSSGNDALEFVQTGLLSYFVSKAFGRSREETDKICVSVVEVFLRDLYSLKAEDVTKERMKTFFSLWKCGLMEKDSLHEFCVHALYQFIKEPIAAVTEAFAVQENCKNQAQPFHINAVIETFLANLKTDDVAHLLFDIGSDDILNWKNYTVILFVFIRTCDKASEIILGQTGDLIKKSFQNLNRCNLERAILIGRQVALSSEDPFPVAYKQWFLTHFGDNLQVKSPQGFAFLIQVLSDFIPHETNVGIIKVALERTLSVPSECQSIYSDYVALLKTRVNDLEPRVQPVDVVNKLLKVYEETGKIPSYVMEASLMRKHYFLNEFLPVLLSPRVVPAFPDVREKFIEELYRLGKIPGAALLKYKTGCDQEKHKLLAGMDVECNFMDEDM